MSPTEIDELTDTVKLFTKISTAKTLDEFLVHVQEAKTKCNKGEIRHPLSIMSITSIMHAKQNELILNDIMPKLHSILKIFEPLTELEEKRKEFKDQDPLGDNVIDLSKFAKK